MSAALLASSSPWLGQCSRTTYTVRCGPGSEKKLNGRGKIRNSFFHCSASHPTQPIPTWAHDESGKVSERSSFFIFLIRENWETQWCDIAIAEMGRNNNKKVPHSPKFISRINLSIWPPLSHIVVAPKNGHLKIKLASLWATDGVFPGDMFCRKNAVELWKVTHTFVGAFIRPPKATTVVAPAKGAFKKPFKI